MYEKKRDNIIVTRDIRIKYIPIKMARNKKLTYQIQKGTLQEKTEPSYMTCRMQEYSHSGKDWHFLIKLNVH